MKSFVLASGSKGNCYYAELSGFNMLIDFGLTYERTKNILKNKNIDINEIDAVFITHEHIDHCLGLDMFLKKNICDVYMTLGTYEALKDNLGETAKIVIIKPDIEFVVNESISILPLLKSHDAKEPVNFVISNGKDKIGVFTDMGFVSDETKKMLCDIDILFIEANYDYNMLMESGLGFNYINRVLSNIGHLSVFDVAKIIPCFARDGQKIILSHVSENSNTYVNAYSLIRSEIDKINVQCKLLVSYQDEESDWIE